MGARRRPNDAPRGTSGAGTRSMTCCAMSYLEGASVTLTSALADASMKRTSILLGRERLAFLRRGDLARALVVGLVASDEDRLTCAQDGSRRSMRPMKRCQRRHARVGRPRARVTSVRGQPTFNALAMDSPRSNRRVTHSSHWRQHPGGAA